MNQPLTPFSDQQGHIGTLNVDNAFDVLVLDGELVVTRSKQGLDTVNELMAFLKKAQKVLKKDQAQGILPLEPQNIPPIAKVNPFD